MKSVKKILISIIAGLGVLMITMPANAIFDGKFKQEVEKETGAVKLVREVVRGGYDVVTAEELKEWMDEKKDEQSYKKNHVPGAVQLLFPIPEMTEWKTAQTNGKTKTDFEALLGPDKNKMIVVYCGFVKCTRSHNGAAWAKKLGYKNVYRFAGGIFAWKGVGYPVGKVD